jgi:hypothetical protein
VTVNVYDVAEARPDTSSEPLLFVDVVIEAAGVDVTT